MDHLRSFGAIEIFSFVVLVGIGTAVRRWLARADRDGTYDRSRYVYRRGTVGRPSGMWASPHQRSAAERHQPEQELPPLPFRDQREPASTEHPPPVPPF